MATESTHPKTLKSSRGPRRGSRLGLSWLWWGGWRCGQWLRGWWGWKLRGGGCSSRSRRPLRGISLPLTHRSGGVNNSPARVPRSFRLCPALRQLTRLSPPRAVSRRDLFPISVHLSPGDGGPARGRHDQGNARRERHGEYSPLLEEGISRCAQSGGEAKRGKRAHRNSHALLRGSFFPTWRA